MLASATSENNQTKPRRTWGVHRGTAVGDGIRMVAGFHYNITATGGVEGRYRKKVGEEQVCISQLESRITIWASLFSEENMEQQ